MSRRTEQLRVLDFGRVSPLRSQTLWHALSYGVSQSRQPTLSFARPDAPYVSVGYHRSMAEVDLQACASAGWPVYRRMVGGGPVWLDDGQLFFQITLPADAVSAFRTQALHDLLAPAVTAFQAAGVAAVLDDALEIVVDDRKICGHGAGQIEDAVVVCGNLIERFDHRAATTALRLPSAQLREDVERLMRRYVQPTPVDAAAFQQAAVTAYAQALGLQPVDGELTPIERQAVDGLDAQFTDPDWLAGPPRAQRAAAQVKVRSGVWVFEAAQAGTRAVVSVVDGCIERARLSDPALNGSTGAAERALVGRPLLAAAQVLADYGPAGRRLTDVLALADGRGSL